MSCPDVATLELWLAGLLDPAEADVTGAHVESCDRCAPWAEEAEQANEETVALAAALTLTTEELDYLRRLDLASVWRPAPAGARWLDGLPLVACLATAAAWSLAAPALAQVGELAAWAGLGPLLAQGLLFLLWAAGTLVIELGASPLAEYALPLLALLGLALLLWPARLAPSLARR